VNTQQSFEFARQHHRAGRLMDAEAICAQIVAAEPRHADALHLLGVIAGQTGRSEAAVDWLRQSIAARPDHPEAQKNLGVALRAVGETDEAIAAYRRAISLKPDYAEAHKNLGNALYQSGRLDDTIAAYRQAILFHPGNSEAHCNLGAALKDKGLLSDAIAECRAALALRPNYPEAHNHLGNALHDAGQLDEAIAAYRVALQLRPGFAAACNNLGVALRGKGRHAEAIAAFREALRLRPDYADAWDHLGSVLQDEGQLDEAIAAHRKAIELKPDYADAFGNLGHALKQQGLLDEAIAAYREAVRLKPDSPDWQHVLAALTGEHSATTPASYVRKLFDPYAAQFDEHLLGQLQYRVPQQLLETVLAVAPGRKFDTLDLGCGTGLCGMLFRPLARKMIGVDLSPAMIAKADARGIYDQLITADLATAMREYADTFDLILAGDTFVYVGDLEAVFAAATRALRDGGLFVFSLERHDGEGFILHSKIRFAHSLAYIRGLSRAHQLAEVHVREIILRKSGPDDVSGWIVVLRK
jgi:predicted TPR repeat methyltransferase